MHVSRSNHIVYLRWYAILLARYSKRWRSRTHSACEKFASRSQSMWIIDSFVTLLLELSSANHTKAPSRINTAFCHVTLSYTRTARVSSARELPARHFPTRFTDLLIARNILSFERLWEITRCRTKCELSVHASYRTHQLSNYRASLTARFEQILIRLNNKFRIVTIKRTTLFVIITRLDERAFHTRWHQCHKHTTKIVK